MGRIFKRTLAAIMVMLIVLTSAPLSGFVGLDLKAFAADDSAELIVDTDDQITRAQWLHNLAVVFEMTVEDEVYPDNYFSDLEDDHEYYYDVLLNVNFGVVDVEAGGEVNPDGLVTRSFASHTLNFCLGYQLEEETYSFSDFADCVYPSDAQVAVNREWFALVDGNFCPEKTVTDAEVEKMMDDTKAVLGDSEIDVNYDSEFTFSDEVIEIKDGTEVEISEGIVVIYDCPEELAEDDIFAVYKSGIPLIYEAESVSVQDDVTTVTATYIDDANGEYILEADAQGEADLEDVIITPAEGVDVALDYEEPASAPFSLKLAKGSKDLANISAKGSIDLGLGYSVSYAVELKDPSIQYSYNIGKRTAQVTFECEVEDKLTFKTDLIEGGGFEKEVLIFNLGLPGVGGLDVYLVFDLNGSISAVTKTSLKVGASYNPTDNFRKIKNFSSNTFSLEISMTGSFGVAVRLGVTQLPFVNAYVYAEAGAKAKVEVKIFDSGVPKNCVDFQAYIYAKYGATFSVKAGIFGFEVEAEEEIWDETTSPAKMVKHYEDNMPVAGCAREGDTNYRNYYTKYDTIFSGGWSGGNNSWGLNDAGEPVQIFEYSVDEDSKATITAYKGNAVIITVPETIDGYTVIAIGNDSFKNNTYIRSVDVPATVTKIGNWAFANCTSLRDVTLHDGLTSIEGDAFRKTAISKIDIPDTVTSMGAAVFAYCSNLKDVELSKSLKIMGAYALGYCDSLQSITIPKSLEETTDAYYWYEFLYGYHHGVFIGSNNLKNIYFEEGITEIPNGLFANNEGIEEVVIPDTVTKIEWGAFTNCINLKSVKLSSSLTEIQSKAFRNTGLTEIVIPDTVTAIGDGAFVDCGNLSNVQLSKSLKTMGAYAFGYCENLESILIPKSIEETTDAYYNEYMYGYHYGVFIGSDNLKTVEFEEGITEIPVGLFANNKGIESVVIPDTVTKIEYSAFLNCENLSSVMLSSSLTELHARSFRNTAITEIDIPDSVKSIADGVFADCKELATVDLPKSLETLGSFSFALCESLTSIEIPKKLVSVTDAYYNEYLYGYHYTPFFHCDNLKTVTFEEGIEEITNSLFAHCTGLETIEIPDTVTVLEDRVFNECPNLKSVKLSDNLTKIYDAAFYNCTSLESIEIPSSVTALGSSVFNGCKSLQNIVIPDSVTSMGEKTFQNCESLKTAVLPSTRQNIVKCMFENCISLEKIELPETVTTIQEYAFKNCTSLSEVVLNDGLQTIQSYAFENCDALTTIDIPDNVNSVGTRVFYDCDVLTDVKLGTGIISIPESTFEHCDALENILLPYRTASVGKNAFKDSVKLSSITIPRATTSIDASAFSYPDKLTIYGVAGTYAETFANENSITFVNKEVSATEVTLDRTEVTINNGQSAKLHMTVTPADFTDIVTWKSSNTDVVTIAEDGTLTAKSVGTATVKLDVGSVSTSCAVTVLQPVTRVDIDGYNLTLQAHDTYQLNAYVSPDNAANKEIQWSSSAPEIATVDENGFVVALKKGETEIKAEALDGSGKYDTCKITVSNNGVIAQTVEELESPHDYEVNCSDFWQYTLDGAESISVTFDERTNVEDGFDYIYIYDVNGDEIGSYTGTELAGETIEITGDTVRIQLISDASGIEWGFKVTDVVSGSIEGGITEPDEEDTTSPEESTTEPTTNPGTDGATVIEPGQTVSFSDMELGGFVMLTFTPAVSGEYTFYSTSDKDMFGTVLESDGETLVEYNDDADYDSGEYDFKVTCYLKAGKQYYLHVQYSMFEQEAGPFSVTLVMGDGTEEPSTTKPTTTEPITTKPIITEPTTQPTTGGSQGGSGSGSGGSSATPTTKPTTAPVTQPTTKPVPTTKPSTGNQTEQPSKATKPAKVKIKSVKSPKKKRIVVTWNKVTGANGYEVMYSTAKKFKKKVTKTVTIKKGTKAKVTIKKLKSKKKYFVKVRAYKTVNGSKLCGAWSKAKNVKVK